MPKRAPPKTKAIVAKSATTIASKRASRRNANAYPCCVAASSVGQRFRIVASFADGSAISIETIDRAVVEHIAGAAALAKRRMRRGET
jgi:hypothetical protein